MKEYILCAAIWWDDQKEHEHQPHNVGRGFVVCGRRHPDILYIVDELTSRTRNIKELQGFITNTNRFVDRKEAYEIAEKAGQIINTENNHKILFSEDLY